MIVLQDVPQMTWLPAELQAALNVLQRSNGRHEGRRASREGERQNFVAPATFLLGRLRHTLYLRDLGSEAAGFLTDDALDIGLTGTLIFHDLRGEEREVPVTVRRCRPVTPGVFEGYFQFAA